MSNKIKDTFKKAPWSLIGIGCLGILLLIWGSFPRKKSSPVATQELQVRLQIGEEEKLTEILSLAGIGNIRVMITYKDEGKKHVATDENIETTYENGKVTSIKENSQVVRMRNNSGEIGLILVEETPKVSGVVVTSSRPISTAQKLKIIEAVRALWDLPLGRIVVLGKE
ncbi:MAG: hypothetical protein PHD88_05840 [Firmicutes bacterium]|nr:hypothetical protein [Bacillota bacterium]MDD4693901.1 hypothetical protein [Bacillota bacterium]